MTTVIGGPVFTAVKHLIAAGLYEEALEVVMAFEVQASTSTAKSGQQRTAEWRERQRQNLDACDDGDGVTSHVTESPHTPYIDINITNSLPEGSGERESPRQLGTNPRAKGTNPRASGTNPRSLLAPLFEEFWEAYPRKVGKGAAKRAFKTAMGKATREVILAGVNRLVASKPDPQFTPHPATWLNQERWLDEPEMKVTRTVVPGPWKVFDPVKEEEKFKGLTAEERQRRIDKAANITQLLRQSLNRADPPCDVEVNPS